MDDVVTIENIDDILGVMAKTPIVDDTCFFFLEGDVLAPEIIKFINKSSASDTDVALTKFLIDKGYKKFNAGLAIKMWIDWDSVHEISAEKGINKFKTILDAKVAERKLELENTGYTDPKTGEITPKIGWIKARDTYIKLLGKYGHGTPYEHKFLLETKLGELLKKMEGGGFIKRLSEKRILAQIDEIKQTIELLKTYIEISDSMDAVGKAHETVNKKLDNLIGIASYKALKYEKCVYSYITDNIIRPGNISPNFIPLIAAKSCLLGQMLPLLNPKGKSDGLSPEKYKLLKELTSMFPELKLNFIITGTTTSKGSLKSLNEMMNFFNANLENAMMFRPVFFQAVYSLAVMDFFGVVHNDLHFGNMFVQELPSEICMQFQFPSVGKEVTLHTKYILKFFDWDRGYIESLGDNKLLDFTVYTHAVNSARTKQDFSQFLCGMSRYSEVWEDVSLWLDYSGHAFPPSRDSYYFEPGGSTFLEIEGKNELLLINDYITTKTPKIYIDNNGMKWYEIKTSFVKSIKRLHQAFDKIYGKNIDDFDKVFMGIITRDDKITIVFPSGWHCQSLFDFKDSVLGPVSSLVKNKKFLGYANHLLHSSSCDSERKKSGMRNYVFPSTKPLDVSKCSYSM